MNAPRPTPSRRSGQLQAAADRGELPLWAVLVVASGVLALGFGGGSHVGNFQEGVFASELSLGQVQASADLRSGTEVAAQGELASVSDLDELSARRDALESQPDVGSAARGRDDDGSSTAAKSDSQTPDGAGDAPSDVAERERTGGAELWRSGLREEGSYHEGVRHGLWRAWREDGSLRSQGTYVHGLRDGVWEAFGENGALLSELAYEEGIRSGFWTAYSESGAVLEEGQYSGDAATGRWTTYYSGGQVKERGLFVNGLREGMWEFYDDLGQPTLQAGEYRAGIKIQ